MIVSPPSYGLEDLTPPGNTRSEGIHASVLLDRIRVRLGHYEKKFNKSTGQYEPISDINRELGNAFEDMIAQKMTAKHPGEFIHNPEIECDGIYLTPDLVWMKEQADHEIKVTRMSPAIDPHDDKMWGYLEQGKSYLYGLRRVTEGTARIRLYGEDEWLQCDASRPPMPMPADAYLTLYLTVLFLNDYRPVNQQCPTWKIQFWPEELAMTWAMLLSEKSKLEKEIGQ